MTRKEIFYGHLAPFLEKEGFVLKRNDFVKKVNKDVFSIEIEIFTDFGYVQTKYRMHIYDIEQVKKKALGKKYDKRFSSGNDRYIVSGKNKDEMYLDTDTEELALRSAEREIMFYLDTVKNYFRDYSDVVFLDDLLNTIPGDKLDAAFNTVDTSFLAVVVAYLCKRKNLSELIPVYRKVIERDNNSWLAEYDLLTDYVTTQ